MKIVEVPFRNRNDFHWVGECESCGHRQKYQDGYADSFYCTQVVPGRFCSECGLNSHGEKSPD